MKGFHINLKTDDIEFELRIEELEENDKDFVREILRMIDRKTTTPQEEAKINELKEDYKTALIGYNTLANDISGIHRGIDEYIAREVEEQLAEELLTKEDKVLEKVEEKVEEIPKDEEVTLNSDTIGDATEDSQANKLISTDTQDTNPSVRLNHNKEKLYQTFYICPKCSNKGKRYIPRQAIYITCHNCSRDMRIKPATSKGFPNPDSYGNVFIAGNFIRVEDLEIQEEKNSEGSDIQ